ncbi:MAG: GH25 family lysozyme [Erysipelotrichaceae bacterium]|nr:GH25 family lysozyme [Erysipelotrichaceae bacterium]
MNKKENVTKVIIVILAILTILCFTCFIIVVVKPDLFEKNETNEIVEEDQYDYSLIKGGEILTYEDDEYTSMFGIDVSEFSDDIDWEKVKRAGVQFVYIRLGYRGKNLGNLFLDEQFENYYEGAKAVGLKVGVYFYSQATSQYEAAQEANFVLENIADKQIDFPIAYDLEIADDNSRVTRTTPLDKSNNALSFINVLNNHGYECLIYTNDYFSNYYYSMGELKDCDFWYAQYGVDKPSFKYNLKIWQYSQSYKIEGIDGNVDFNLMFIQKNDQY